MRLLCLSIALLMLVSCAPKTSEHTIPAEDMNPDAGADSYGLAGNNPKSMYYVNPDFYELKSDKNLTLIEKFKTMQQTDEWSCGNATAQMVLWHFGTFDFSEAKIAKEMESHTDKDTVGAGPGTANNFGEYGTNVEQMYEFFSKQSGIVVVETSYKASYTDAELTKEGDFAPPDVGNLPPVFSAMSLYTSDNSADSTNYTEDAKDSYFVKWLTSHLTAGRPIMVEWGDWDGHWQAIIGYDNNGTPSIGDDIIIFADPYDTGDHLQDGYYYYSLERWFYMWQDRKIAPKPYQLQQYIIIDKA